MQAHFRSHNIMDCCLTVAVLSVFQIGRHVAVSVYSIVVVVDLFNLFLGFYFYFENVVENICRSFVLRIIRIRK